MNYIGRYYVKVICGDQLLEFVKVSDISSRERIISADIMSKLFAAGFSGLFKEVSDMISLKTFKWSQKLTQIPVSICELLLVSLINSPLTKLLFFT
ncbi:hypothetical protein BTO09_13420 [Gilvibacter sp. SZ-19]|nr:hypothetical protein BTO09_13420 [Gilvibacter sp. SZ-19]